MIYVMYTLAFVAVIQGFFLKIVFKRTYDQMGELLKIAGVMRQLHAQIQHQAQCHNGLVSAMKKASEQLLREQREKDNDSH